VLDNLRSIASSMVQDAWFEGRSRRWAGGAVALSVAVSAAWTLSGELLPLPVSAALAALLALASAQERARPLRLVS